MTYNVQDSSGNDAVQVTRIVNVVDTTVPVITLKGANPVICSRLALSMLMLGLLLLIIMMVTFQRVTVVVARQLTRLWLGLTLLRIMRLMLMVMLLFR